MAAESRPVDLAMVIHSMDGGGAERVCLYLAEEYARRGLVVDLVLCQATGPYLAHLPASVRVVDLEVESSVAWTRRLAGYFAGHRPAHVLAFMEGAGIVAAAARALTRRAHRPRLWISVHNHFSAHVKGSRRRRERYLLQGATRLLLPRADGLIGVSRGVSDDLAAFLGLPASAVHTVYNPVITPRFLSLAAEPPSHPWAASREHASALVVAAGRMTEQKGFDTLLRAIARVRAERDVRLLLLGEGPLRSSLEAQVAREGLTEHVSMPGFVENPFAIFAHADLFVLSSRWEGFGLVLVEAMACGCPVVSTDCPSGPAEILENGTYGPLVPVDDDVALASAILRRLAAPVDEDALERRGLTFTLEATADGYASVMGLKPRTH